MISSKEFKLTSPPDDAISAVEFAPNNNQFLLVSSWDKSVGLYDVTTNSLKSKYFHKSAVLDCCFSDEGSHSYSGGLSKTLKSFDLATSTETIMGKHDQPIKCVEYCHELNVVLTGSWDKHVKLWDPRREGALGNYNQSEKVFAMSISGNELVVATSWRKILIWDIRNMSYTSQKRESNLKYQTRALKCFPNKQGFVLSSLEGRVAVEYFDVNPEVQKKKYAFKCHRIKENGVEKVYPVNAISFHPIYNTFATGGSDGYVNIWDGFNKRKLCQFERYHTSVTSLSFGWNGEVLAVACSYFLEEENPPTPYPENIVHIRSISSGDSRPKFANTENSH